jgi:hypothetical protein
MPVPSSPRRLPAARSALCEGLYVADADWIEIQIRPAVQCKVHRIAFLRQPWLFWLLPFFTAPRYGLSLLISMQPRLFMMNENLLVNIAGSRSLMPITGDARAQNLSRYSPLNSTVPALLSAR